MLVPPSSSCRGAAAARLRGADGRDGGLRRRPGRRRL